jgi:hemolysin III
LPVLVQREPIHVNDRWNALGAGVFALTMMLLYLSSALYHALPPGRGKRLFERLDHAAIYLFIAGTYSGFAASALQGSLAWIMLALVWLLALLAALVTLCRPIGNPLWAAGLYVVMGWLVLLAAMPWIGQVSPVGVRLLLAGGLSYTLGAVLYLESPRVRFAHFLWHLFVMAGSGLHFAAVLWHA